MARILMLLPCAVDAPRGNVTTAERLAKGLAKHGHEVRIQPASEAADSPACDAIVAFHARHSAPVAQALAEQRGVPYVVLFTGTDLNGRPNAASRQAVEKADACVVLALASAKRARELYGGPKGRYLVIKQAVTPLPEPREPGLPEGLPPLRDDDQLVLMLAGIRAVKAPRHAVQALAPLAQKRPNLRLWIVGPGLELRETAALRAELERNPWAAWPGSVPRDRLLPVVRRAALVLSTSRSEGGSPNALLEAAMANRAILASDIPGHRDFPGPEHMFEDNAQLRRLVAGLLDDDTGRARDAAKLRDAARTRYTLPAETAAWVRTLQSVLA